MDKFKRLVKDYYLFVLFSLMVLLVWQYLVKSGKVPSFIVPAPTSIIQMIFENKHSLFVVHLMATIKEIAIGFVIAFIGGMILSIGMYFFKPVEKIMYPFILISQTIPIIALSPIFVLWFGYSIWSKVAVTILISFFPIVLNFYDGLKNGDKDYHELLTSMGAKRWQIFLKVEMPFALSPLLSGVKLAIVFAVVGATIGEWLGASEGLGYYSRRMSGNLNSEGVFAAVVILSLLGMFLFILVSLLERKILYWKRK